MDKYSAMFHLEPTIQKREMIQISEYIADVFGVIYKKVGTIGNIEGKEKKSFRKYSNDELQKILDADDYDIRLLSFQNIRKIDGWYDTTVSLDYNIPTTVDHPVKMKLIIDPNVTEKHFFHLMNTMLEYMHSIGIKLWYGMATLMEEKKLPTFFFIGVMTPYMTEEERRIASAMAHYQADYQTKIWDIFEYNVTRKEIISDNMMKKIERILGAERITEANGVCIFTLMDDLEQTPLKSKEVNASRNKLRSVFEKENRIMFRSKERN